MKNYKELEDEIIYIVSECKKVNMHSRTATCKTCPFFIEGAYLIEGAYHCKAQKILGKKLAPEFWTEKHKLQYIKNYLIKELNR